MNIDLHKKKHVQFSAQILTDKFIIKKTSLCANLEFFIGCASAKAYDPWEFLKFHWTTLIAKHNKWWYSFLHIFQATFWTVQRFNPIPVIYTPFGVFVLKRIDSLLNQGCWEPYTYHSGMIYTTHLLNVDFFLVYGVFCEFQNPYTNHYPII